MSSTPDGSRDDVGGDDWLAGWRGPALTAALVGLFLSPLWSGRYTPIQHDISLSDLLHATLPYRAFIGRVIATGDFPLWMPGVFSGLPLAGEIEAGLYHIPTWIFFSFLPPLWALGWAASTMQIAAAVGTERLTKALGAGGWGAVFAGVAYGLCGFEIARIKHINIHSAAAWMPWLLLAGLWAAQGKRKAGPALAIVVAAIMFAGHPQIAYYGFAAAAAWFVCMSFGIRCSPREWSRRVGIAALAAGVGLALTAVVIFPTAALYRDSPRSSADMAFLTAFQFPWVDLWYFVLPAARGFPYDCNWSNPGVPSLAWEDYAYVGILPLFFAIRETFAWRHIASKFMVTLTLFALLFALGNSTPLFALLRDWIPGMAWFRMPTRALFLVDLGLAVLAGLGFGAATAAWPRQRLRAAAAAALAFTLVDLGVNHRAVLALDSRAAWEGQGAIAETILGDQPTRTYTLRPLQIWRGQYTRMCEMNGDRRLLRELAPVPLGSGAVTLGLWTADGYTAMSGWRTHALWGRYNRDLLDVQAPIADLDEAGHLPGFAVNRLRKAAVSHVVSLGEADTPALRLAASEGAFDVYRLQGAFARAYVAQSWVSVSGWDAMLAQLDSVDARPAIEGATPSVGDGGNTPVTVVDESPQHIRVDVSGHAGALVVTDTWSDGWRARVDGVVSPVLVANGYQRAVLLPKGAREVVFDYIPPGFRVGLATSLLAILGWLVWVGLAWPRSTRVEPTLREQPPSTG